MKKIKYGYLILALIFFIPMITWSICLSTTIKRNNVLSYGTLENATVVDYILVDGSASRPAGPYYKYVFTYKDSKGNDVKTQTKNEYNKQDTTISIRVNSDRTFAIENDYKESATNKLVLYVLPAFGVVSIVYLVVFFVDVGKNLRKK